MVEEPLNLINDDKTSDKVVIDFHCKGVENPHLLCGTLGIFYKQQLFKIRLKNKFGKNL